MEKAINQDDVRIREVLPALNSHLRDEFSSLRSAVLANHAVITRTSDSVANLSKTVSGVLSGKAFLKINLNASDADVPSENGLISTDSPDKVTCVQGEAGSNDLLLCRLMILLTCINFPYSGFIIIKREDKSCFVRSPSYIMNREISTVHDLWREWSIGLGTGPSVKSLEEAWGPRWRQTPTETRFFNRRRISIY